MLAYLDDPCDFPGQKVDSKKLRRKLGWLREHRRPLAAWAELLESLPGKYKRIQGTHSKGGMTGLLLSIGAAVLKKSTTVVQTALATVPAIAVAQWVRDQLGLTIPAQQALAFQRNKNDPKHPLALQPSI